MAAYDEAVDKINDNPGVCDEVKDYVDWKKTKMVHFKT
jgi:hypothetical protein